MLSLVGLTFRSARGARFEPAPQAHFQFGYQIRMDCRDAAFHGILASNDTNTISIRDRFRGNFVQIVASAGQLLSTNVECMLSRSDADRLPVFHSRLPPFTRNAFSRRDSSLDLLEGEAADLRWGRPERCDVQLIKASAVRASAHHYLHFCERLALADILQ